MGEAKKEIRGAAIATIVAFVVGGILAWITGVLPKVWDWLLGIVGDVWDWLNGTTPVLGWIILVVAALACVGAARLVSLWSAGRKRPAWESFCSMDYEGITWTWTWRDGGPVGLQSFCPSDGMELRPTDQRQEVYLAHHWRLVCQKCRKMFGEGWLDIDGAEVDAKFEIQRLLRTGEWQKLLPVPAVQG